MHGNKETDLKAFDELAASEGIAVADEPVYGEHHHIEAVVNLANVLQLAQVLLLMGYRVNVFVKLLAIDGFTRLGFWEETSIPVVQVTSMEDSFDLWLSLHSRALLAYPLPFTLGRVQASLALLSLNRSLVLGLNNPRYTAVCAA